MHALIVEDQFICRKVLQTILSKFGECEIAVDGNEAIEAFKLAWEENNPYNLICLDIVMPNINGREALKAIRDIENQMGVNDDQRVKIIMTTALDDADSVVESYKGGATAYLVKPVLKDKIIDELNRLGLIE